MSGYSVATAPKGQTRNVVAQEAGGFAGGLAGGMAATGVVGLVGMGAAAVGLVVAAPVVLGVGVVAGLAGAFYGASYGRDAGTYYHNLLKGWK